MFRIKILSITRPPAASVGQKGSFSSAVEQVQENQGLSSLLLQTNIILTWAHEGYRYLSLSDGTKSVSLYKAQITTYKSTYKHNYNTYNLVSAIGQSPKGAY